MWCGALRVPAVYFLLLVPFSVGLVDKDILKIWSISSVLESGSLLVEVLDFLLNWVIRSMDYM